MRQETRTSEAIVVTREGRVERRRVDAPRAARDRALVRTLLVGIDGTDEEIAAREHGELPSGRDAMVLGHECLGEVVEAPEGSGLVGGDRVVPMVRHGCARCARCAQGRVDLCETGDHLEHGIKGLDGFLRDVWLDDPATLVPVPPGLGDDAVLTEPLSVVVKALGMASAMQARLPSFTGFRDSRVLLAGTGSLGTLAAFLLRDEGARVWALDRSSHDAAGARLLARLGVRHVDAREEDVGDVAKDVGGFDLVVEATGAPEVAFESALHLARNGAMAMLGVPGEEAPISFDAAALMRHLVLRNQVVCGSVNAAPVHYEEAMRALGRFRERWGGLLDDLVTHRFDRESAARAILREGEGVVKKVVAWA